MITAEYKKVYQADFNGKKRSFFQLNSACRWLARQIINNNEDCSCGDITHILDCGLEVYDNCSYHRFLRDHPDEFKKIYDKEFLRIKDEFKNKIRELLDD